MMKKILFVFMIVLASTNVLAQDLTNILAGDSKKTLELIAGLRDSTDTVISQFTSNIKIRCNDSITANEIKEKLKNTKEYVIDIINSDLNLDEKLTLLKEIDKMINGYKTAIYNRKGTRIYILSCDFIDQLNVLDSYVKEKKGLLAQPHNENDPSSIIPDTSEIPIVLNNVDTMAIIHVMSDKLLVVDIKKSGVVISSTDFKYLMAFALFFLFIVIFLLVWIIRLFKLTIKKEYTPPITEKVLREIVIGLGDNIEKNFNTIFGSVTDEIKNLNTNASSLLSNIKSSFNGIEKNRLQCVKQGENHKNSLPQSDTSKHPLPQIVKYYGNLNSEGTKILKTTSEPREEYFYQINLKNEKDTKGELVIREGLSTDKMKEAIKDRSRYLKSSACDITLDAESATRVETVKNGVVEKQGYDWKITERVQVKIV